MYNIILKAHEKKLEVAEMKMLHCMCGLTRRDIRNETKKENSRKQAKLVWTC